MLHNPFDQMDAPFDQQNTFSSRTYLNSALSRFALCASLRLHPPSSPTGRGGLRRPGGKGARKAFLLSQGKLCFAKMLLAPHMSLLRIILGGAAAPPNLPSFRLPDTLCCTIYLEKQYTYKERGYCRWSSAASPLKGNRDLS